MKNLDPRAVWLLFFRNIFVLVFFVLIIGMTSFPLIFAAFSQGFLFIDRFLLLLIVFIIVCLAISYLWAKLSFDCFKYETADMGFRKESGVIVKKYVTIPYDRIQNIDIRRGVIPRILGLSDIYIQTAGISVGGYGRGSVVAEGYVPGLSIKDAEVLRDELLIKVKKSKEQGI